MQLGELDATTVGIGGRLTFDLTRWIAIDGELNLFPDDDLSLGPGTGGNLTAGLIYHRRRTDGFAGLRLGSRFDRVGVFARVRPGFSQLTDQGIECNGDVCALILLAVPEYRTAFALDLGGGLEFHSTPRTVARVDVGDVMIWNRSFTPPCSDCTTHNFTTRLGFGVRF